MSSSKPDPSGGKNQKGLTVDTSHGGIVPTDESPPPLSALTLGSSSSSPGPLLTQTSTGSGLFTPTNQPIMTREERLAEANAFIERLGFVWGDLDDEQRKRTMRVMSPDWHCSPQDPKKRRDLSTFGPEFEKFKKKLPKNLCNMLEANPAHMFYDEGAIDEYLVIRLQKSGICPLHASSLFQHYMHCKRKGISNHNVLDICTYIRTQLDPVNQKRYIEFGTTVYDSSTFFRDITGTPLLHYSVSRDRDIKFIHSTFSEDREPMLLGSVRLFSDRNDPVWEGSVSEEQYEEYALERKKNEGRRPQLHSLVIIGAFEDTENKKTWFVVQNFWQSAWFHLIDGDRLIWMVKPNPNADKIKPMPGIYICHHGFNTSLTERCPTVDGVYSECEVEMDEGDGRWAFPVDPNEPVEEEEEEGPDPY